MCQLMTTCSRWSSLKPTLVKYKTISKTAGSGKRCASNWPSRSEKSKSLKGAHLPPNWYQKSTKLQRTARMMKNPMRINREI